MSDPLCSQCEHVLRIRFHQPSSFAFHLCTFDQPSSRRDLLKAKFLQVLYRFPTQVGSRRCVPFCACKAQQDQFSFPPVGSGEGNQSHFLILEMLNACPERGYQI